MIGLPILNSSPAVNEYITSLISDVKALLKSKKLKYKISKKLKGGNITKLIPKGQHGLVSKLLNGFVGVSMAENPAVMTASGWLLNNGLWELKPSEESKQLAENLVAISAFSPTNPATAIGDKIIKSIPTIGKMVLYGLAKSGNNWARAKVLSSEMVNPASPNKYIPNNVGWAPKQTILVSHASNKNKLPNLYFDKRWDVSTENANPHGIWYQGKLGIPRTDLTNPGKGLKALKARDLFTNRKYHLNGELVLEKPMQTIGDVKNRALLSYTADNMGADGLIYNDIYDNGYNHNQVILGWKLLNPQTTKNSLSTKNSLKYDFFDDSNPDNLSPVGIKSFFKNDIEKRANILGNPKSVPSEDGWYKYELHDFNNNVIGDYTPLLNRVRISRTLDPVTSHTTKVHEFRHKLESEYPLNYEQRRHLEEAYRLFSEYEPLISASRYLSEKTATNTELRAQLYHKFRLLHGGRNPINLLELDLFIDNLSNKEVRDALWEINGYGQDYVQSFLNRIKSAKQEGINSEIIKEGINDWANNIKRALKYVPVTTLGISQIKLENKNSQPSN